MISPHNTILQGSRSAELLSECMGATEHGYRQQVRQLFRDENNVSAVQIVISGDTLEFRISPDNLLLCFIWRGNQRNSASFYYFMDRTCTTYNLVKKW